MTPDQKNIFDGIAALALDAPVAKAKRLLQLLPAIESARAAGVSHKSIHAEINKRGVEIDFKYYEVALKRLRKHIRKGDHAKHTSIEHKRPNNTLQEQTGPKKFSYDPFEAVIFK